MLSLLLTVLTFAPVTDEPAKPDLPGPLAFMGKLVGGTWTSAGGTDGRAKEVRFTWIMDGKVVKGEVFTIKDGQKKPMSEAWVGWDAQKKELFYFDLHGANQVFKGTGRLEGQKLIFEFATAVGPPAQFKSEEEFTDADSYKFTIFVKRGEQWQQVHQETMKRVR